MSENNLEKLFFENKRLRRSMSRIKACITCGIVGVMIVFLVSMWSLFRNFDKEELVATLSGEIRILTPALSNYAVEIAEEALPVYQDAFTREFERLSPQFQQEIEKEMLILSDYLSKEVPVLLQHELQLALERARTRILRECPEFLENEDKIMAAFTNVAVCLQEEAEQLVTTGVFSHQPELLGDIHETLHTGFPVRKSNDTPDELAEHLFNLLGRIIEYEFFAERIEKEEGQVIKPLAAKGTSR